MVALYVAIYGMLLHRTHGVPYVTDGNESYSMLIHASNLYEFPLSKTFGLSDEAVSRDPAAHPYVYTHQGNFPRLFAFVLYVVGARSVESQIAVTTFTVGLLSLFLIYEYFCAVASAGFAAVAVSVFLTDYLLFAQWQVNTYRVWHGVFFFLALLCVHGMEGPRKWRWLAATVVTYACLFYFELVFGVYVGIMCGLYAGIRNWKRLTFLLTCWTAQFTGALVGVAVLVLQLIGYLGWRDFLEDLRVTYTARNLVAADPTYADRIRDFVESRHIVFWYNFATVEYKRSAFEILSSITKGYFSAYTPALWYVVSIVTLGWIVGLCLRTQTEFRQARVDGGSRNAAWSDTIAPLLLLVAWFRFLLAVVHPAGLAGVSWARFDAGVGAVSVSVAAALAAGFVAGTARVATGRWSGVLRLAPLRILGAAAILIVGEQIVMNGDVLFDSSYLPLWSHIQGTWFAGWLVQLLIVAAAALATLLVVDAEMMRDTRWPMLAAYLVSGFVAYIVVYALSPGYVQTGYLVRFVPFASFLIETAVALVIYLALASQRTFLFRKPAMPLATAIPVAASLFLVVYWANVQAVYVRLLPPTHFAFIQQLAIPPFRNASFAANTYTAPIYAYTGEWSYFDTRLGTPDGALVEWSSDGYRVNRDARSYLWLADRHENVKYQRPAYFLCVQYQDLHTAVDRLRGRVSGCSSAGAVRYATDRTHPSVAQEVVARDRSGWDTWAIVKLDWSILDQRPRHGGLATMQ